MLRVVAIAVLSGLALYLLYLVRIQIGYLVLALFLATCASGPVTVLSRRMRRGLRDHARLPRDRAGPDPVGVIADPAARRQAEQLVNNLPAYVEDLEETFNENETLRELNENYDMTGKLEAEAAELIGKLGDTAGALLSIGSGMISSLFAVVTILVLSMFMVSQRRLLARYGPGT